MCETYCSSSSLMVIHFFLTFDTSPSSPPTCGFPVPLVSSLPLSRTFVPHQELPVPPFHHKEDCSLPSNGKFQRDGGLLTGRSAKSMSSSAYTYCTTLED